MSLRLTLRLIAVCALLVSDVPEARARTLGWCLKDSFSEITSEQYLGFASLAERGYQTYLELTPAERKCVYAISQMLTSTSHTEVGMVRSALENYPGLTPEARLRLRTLLGLDQPTVASALEMYRKQFEFLFWSDHSDRHAREVLAVSHTWAREAPPAFRDQFRSVLDSDIWRQRIDQAILLHDSRMSITRELHPQGVLGFLPDELPSGWSDREKILTAILSFLHSKSNVPYAALPAWPTVIEETTVPQLIHEGLIDQHRADEILEVLRSLSRAEIDQMRIAAGWIRISDANRPIGENLRNSLGHSFVLTKGGRGVTLETPSGKIPVTANQSVVQYGQAAIENPVLGQDAQGTITATIRLRVPEPFRTKVLHELGSVPFAQLRVPPGLSWQANSITLTIESILRDYPPEILQNLRVSVQ